VAISLMKTFDEVVHVAEAARLASVGIDGDVLAAQRLDNEVGHEALIVRMHVWAIAIGVEDASDLDVEPMLR
jgi:hypothetical protein